MAVCDICNSPGMGELISSEDMRKAVFKNGFNPHKLGLVAGAVSMASMMGLSVDDMYENWKGTVVAQDTSDWNICSKCMAKLRPYLEGTPRPTGVKHAQASADPLVAAAAKAAAERKYGGQAETPSPEDAPKESESACFIATAACGTGLAPQVAVLREFRDTCLRERWPGRLFISVYQSVSPPIARLIARSPALRCMALTLIVTPAAALARRRVSRFLQKK